MKSNLVINVGLWRTQSQSHMISNIFITFHSDRIRLFYTLLSLIEKRPIRAPPCSFDPITEMTEVSTSEVTILQFSGTFMVSFRMMKFYTLFRLTAIVPSRVRLATYTDPIFSRIGSSRSFRCMAVFARWIHWAIIVLPLLQRLWHISRIFPRNERTKYIAIPYGCALTNQPKAWWQTAISFSAACKSF